MSLCRIQFLEKEFKIVKDYHSYHWQSPPESYSNTSLPVHSISARFHTVCCSYQWHKRPSWSRRCARPLLRPHDTAGTCSWTLTGYACRSLSTIALRNPTGCHWSPLQQPQKFSNRKLTWVPSSRKCLVWVVQVRCPGRKQSWSSSILPSTSHLCSPKCECDAYLLYRICHHDRPNAHLIWLYK